MSNMVNGFRNMQNGFFTGWGCVPLLAIYYFWQ